MAPPARPARPLELFPAGTERHAFSGGDHFLPHAPSEVRRALQQILSPARHRRARSRASRQPVKPRTVVPHDPALGRVGQRELQEPTPEGIGAPGAPVHSPVVEERPGFAGARRTPGGLGGRSEPCALARRRGASRLRRGATNAGGLGGRPEPCALARCRGASRLRRGATNAGGLGGRPEPCALARCRGASRLRRARRTPGGLGAPGALCTRPLSRSVPASPGRDERRGAWGAPGAPHVISQPSQSSRSSSRPGRWPSTKMRCQMASCISSQISRVASAPA